MAKSSTSNIIHFPVIKPESQELIITSVVIKRGSSYVECKKCSGPGPICPDCPFKNKVLNNDYYD